MAVGLVAQHVEGEMGFVTHPLAAGGNRIQALYLRAQRGDQRCGIPVATPAAQHVDQLMIAKQGGQRSVAGFQQLREIGRLGAFGQRRQHGA